MKKLSTLLFFFLLVGIASAQNGVWQARNLNLPQPQFGLFIDVPTSNVAWMATEGGNFPNVPGFSIQSKTSFAKLPMARTGLVEFTPIAVQPF